MYFTKKIIKYLVYSNALWVITLQLWVINHVIMSINHKHDYKVSHLASAMTRPRTRPTLKTEYRHRPCRPDSSELAFFFKSKSNRSKSHTHLSWSQWSYFLIFSCYFFAMLHVHFYLLSFFCAFWQRRLYNLLHLVIDIGLMIYKYKLLQVPVLVSSFFKTQRQSKSTARVFWGPWTSFAVSLSRKQFFIGALESAITRKSCLVAWPINFVLRLIWRLIDLRMRSCETISEALMESESDTPKRKDWFSPLCVMI